MSNVVKEIDDLKEKLMKLADYGKISATAYMLSAATNNNKSLNSEMSLRGETNLPRVLNIVNTTDKKNFIPVYFGRIRIVGFLDTGSDLTVLQDAYFRKIFGDEAPLEKTKITHLLSFSNTIIKVYGGKTINIKLDKKQTYGHPHLLHICEDIPNSPPFVLGLDFMRARMGLIGYTGDPANPYPEVIFKHPNVVQCQVFEESPKDLFLCHGTCILEPYEVRDIEFYLSKAAPVIRTDHILISGQAWDTVSIIPSRSDLEYVPGIQRYSATGRVVNLSNERVKCQVTGKYELINDYETINLVEQNKDQLRINLQKYPLGREILMANKTANIQLPIVTINSVSGIPISEMQVSDIDLADTVCSKEPTYYGEAEIKAEIIEPSGLEMPTIIYKNAAEAVDLSAYNEDVRPYIEDIFIKKYPEVVALHSLDAGNLSNTLGFVQLRLREGEMLPRSRRIFHVSPSDTRHLDDICDLLIKFGYIMRSPICPNGTHLYGLSAYLVPRSKPNCMGRLIVD